MWQGDNGGGGGFVGSQGGTQFESPAGDKAKGRNVRSKNIVPITIKQVLDCESEDFHIGEIELNTVTIVGLVVKVDQTPTKVSLHLDDQTGVIDCYNYVGADGSSSSVIPFVPVEGTYGRITGAPRSSKTGAKYLIIYRFFPVMDMNELTAHMLEVTQLPMILKKLKETEGLKTGVGMSGLTMNNTLGNSMVAGQFGGMGMGGSGGGGAPMQATKSPFNNVQNSVLNIIKSNANASASGIHKDEIMRNLKGSTSVKELEKILEDLSAEGHIYSTVDDDHYRSTD